MKPLTDADYIHALIAGGGHQQQDFKFEKSQISLSIEKRIKKKGLLVKPTFFVPLRRQNATLDILFGQKVFSCAEKEKNAVLS